MLLRPNNIKFLKKFRKQKQSTYETRDIQCNYGIMGLKVINRGQISARQIEAARKAIVGTIKRKGKVWIKIFPDFPRTKKPVEVRMGKGKGNVDQWVVNIKPGKVIYELIGENQTLMREALLYAATKLPVQSKIICKPIA